MQDKKFIPISIYNSGWSKKYKKHVPGVVAMDFDFYTFAYNIKNGAYKPIIEPLRAITDPEAKKAYKTEKLLSVSISAVCRTPRSESNIVRHSGILCIDIDPGNNPHITDWDVARDQFAERIPCVMSALSCSLRGFFMVVKIDPKLHAETFEYIEYEFKKMGVTIDPAPKNPISLRFVSYDPDCYINDNFDNVPVITPTPEFWEYKKVENEKLAIARMNAKPVTSANDKALFQNASAEAEIKGYRLERGTGTRLIQFIVGYCNGRGMNCQNCINFFIDHYGVTEYYTAESITDRITDMYELYDSQHGSVPFNTGASVEISFFDIIKDKKGSIIIKLNRVRFLNYFHTAGIGLYMVEKVAVLIRLTGSTFEQITIEQLKKLVQSHINSLPETFDCGISRLDLLEFIYKGSDNYFGKGFIEFINRFTPDYLKDDKDTGYLPFKNGVVCVSKGKPVLKSYDELGKQIWKDQVIDHDITLDDYSPFESNWHRFMSCISGFDGNAKTQEQSDNLFYLQCLTGYLIHKYKDPAKPFAVILAEQTQSEEKGGGTGKGIFIKGIGYVSSVCLIPGKKFNPGSDKFAYQRVQLHNNIAAIDDVPQKFPFDTLYNTITEGMAIECKGQQEIFIPYENSPKIIVITNFVINSSGNHAARRQRVFEFAPFFNPRYTPEQYFGHILFRDWDVAEWNRFYNLQIHCLRQYLMHGLADREKSDTLKRREIRQRYGGELEAWFFEQYFPNGCEDWKGISDLYTDFLSYANMEKPDYSMKRFSHGIKSATVSAGHEMLSDRKSIPSQPDGKKQKVNMVKIVKQNNGHDTGSLDGVGTGSGTGLNV